MAYKDLQKRMETQRRYYQEHREKKHEQQRRYQKAHPERAREYRKAHIKQRRESTRRSRQRHPEIGRRAAHKRRALERGAKIGPIKPDAIYTRDNGICQICKRRVAKREASLDHIVPLSKGGSHTMANLQLAHRRCNYKRGAGRIPAQTRLNITGLTVKRKATQ